MSNRPQLYKQIVAVMVDLEVISSPVRNKSPIEDVDLSNCPPVKARFAKRAVKKICVSNLDVAHSRAQTPHTQTSRNAAGVVVMSQPTDCPDAAINICQLEEFYL